MKRYRQTLDQLLESLSAVETSWTDAHSEAVIRAIATLPDRSPDTQAAIRSLLDADFQVGLTIIRLALESSKDELLLNLRNRLGKGGVGVQRYRASPDEFLRVLTQLGAPRAIAKLSTSPVTWRDILIERLKTGRGSAIKGQKRGRWLEDFTDRVLQLVFGDIGYDTRCRFSGASGISTEKADFAIPSRSDPCILIETKAYGATGSKQTDILGDIARIVVEKRHDTHLLFVTDGLTWKSRVNDLRKLVLMQNEGKIARIYTQSMAAELEADLRQLRRDHGL